MSHVLDEVNQKSDVAAVNGLADFLQCEDEEHLIHSSKKDLFCDFWSNVLVVGLLVGLLASVISGSLALCFVCLILFRLSCLNCRLSCPTRRLSCPKFSFHFHQVVISYGPTK